MRVAGNGAAKTGAAAEDLPLSEPQSNAHPVAPAVFTRRREGRKIVTGVAVALLAIVVVAGALAWQATSGAVSLDFLRGRIEAAVRARLPADASVTIGSTALSYRRDEGVILRARDVKLRLPGKTSVAAAEFSTVTTPSALASGALDLRSITVSGVEIGLVPTGGDGERGGTVAEALRQSAARFAAQLVAADNAMRGAGLEAVSVRDATLRLLDADGQSGPALRFAEIDWRPTVGDRSDAVLKVATKVGASWDLILALERGELGDNLLSVDVEKLSIAALAPNLADDLGGAYYRGAEFTLRTRLTMAADGSLANLLGTVSTGSGELSFTGKDHTNVAGMDVSFVFGADSDRLEIPSAEISTPAGSASLDGHIALGEAGQITLAANVREGLLPTPLAAQPLPLTGGIVSARFDLDDMIVQIERFELTTAQGALGATGQAKLAGPDAGIAFDVSLSQMPVADARALWPPFIATKTRAWFSDNLKSGTLGPATLNVTLPADHIGARGRDKILPDDGLIGALPFRDIVFAPINGFPNVAEASGDITFADAIATILFQAGSLDMPGKGALDVAGTVLAIPELGKPRLRGNLHLQLSGPAAAMAILSDTPPLSVGAERGIEADALTGQAQLALDANIPLEGQEAGDLDPTFRLVLSDFTSTTPIDDRLIGEADLVLEGSPETFTVQGEGLLDGIQASVELILGTAAREQTDVSMTLDAAARERLGLNFGEFLSGPVQASVKTAEDGAQLIGLDLKASRISAPFLGWEKGEGVPAVAEFTLRKGQEGTRITDLRLSGKGFGAEGELVLGADGKLSELTLSEVALRPGDSLSASIAAAGNGYDVKLRGAALDARGIIKSLSAGLGDSTDGAGRIRVDLDVAAITGQNGVVLSDVAGSLTINSAGLDAVSLKGNADGSGPFEWTVKKDGGTRLVRLLAGNGGALIRFAGIYSKIAGGSLVLDYSGSTEGAGAGVLVIRDFRIIDEKALEPAVKTASQAASNRGLSRAEPVSRDLTFSQLRIPFRQASWVVAIDEAALRGPMLGGTGSGTINIPGGKMAISGTFIPAFGINNIAGSIPLLGTILGGGRDEGLVGITYKLFGPLGAPELTMNPISAIAPGIFRKIFEYN